ncbi:hypothetical protein L208DRAFT_1408929 [Tricholoma matsutake]|nr:hypothetical protein L208DRAFT_1408929 [Tricholoma matsutake 945]
MSQNTNSTLGRRSRISAFDPPLKRRRGDPFVHDGRHFGRTVHAQRDIRLLIKNGRLHREMQEINPNYSLSSKELRDYQLFTTLLEMVPGLEDSIKDGGWEEIATMMQRGIAAARSEDTKSLKEVVIDWITPAGQSLIPAIDRKEKAGRGFNHPVTGALLCPTGMDWSDSVVQERLRSGEEVVTGGQFPAFLYSDNTYDKSDHWKGFLRGPLLVKAYKHIFFSPGSVNFSIPARTGQAAIHGMTRVTSASIAYIAAQLRFALSTKAVCLWTDGEAEHVQFYNTLLDVPNGEEDKDRVEALLAWWDG